MHAFAMHSLSIMYLFLTNVQNDVQTKVEDSV